MDNDRTKKLAITVLTMLLALALPVAMAVVGAVGMWRERTERRAATAQFNEALQQSLERAADVVFPAPTLGEGALVLPCTPDKLEAELQRVVRLAEGVGGSASSWNDGASVRIIANVPHSAKTLFRESVERGVYDLSTAGESRPMVMVEVLLRPGKGAPAKSRDKN